MGMKISTTGVITGALTGYGPKTHAAQAKLSGSAKSDGQLTITTTGPRTIRAYVGVWGFNSSGELVMQAVNIRDSSDFLYITLVPSGHVSPYVGDYTGSMVSAYGTGPFLPSFSISSAGLATGTAAPLSDSTSGSYDGTLDSDGVGSLTFTSTAPGYSSFTSEAYAALTPSGQLVIFLTSGYVFALSKSYAGVHKITFGPGRANVEIAVSDNGIVTGGSILGVTPCLLSGTVSASGTLNVTVTSVNSTIFQTLQLTGTVLAVLGGTTGSGTYNGPEHTWTSAGKAYAGLVYAGTYNLSSIGGSLWFTVNEHGSISGTGTGNTVVTGGVFADGTIRIISTTHFANGFSIATSYSGRLSLKSVTSVKGEGTYMRIDGVTNTWTIVGSRV